MHSAFAALCCHLWPLWAISYFSTLPYKLYDFFGGKKNIEYKIWVLIFSKTFV